MSNIQNLKHCLKIDKHALDDEIERQPSLFFDVSEAYVAAAAKRDACKEELASIDAELDAVVRKRLEDNKERITEAAVKNGIQTHADHGPAFDTYMDAKQEADLLFALKEAFQQRGYMLRDLASLYVASYYEQSSVRGDSKMDNAAYSQTRERLAAARGKRGV